MIRRVWGFGQSLMVGPAVGSPPAETPLAAVRMWLRKGDGSVAPNGVDYNAFGDLEQAPGLGHGGELQCGVDLWKAGIANMQIVIARGSTFIGSWAPPSGTYYPRIAEEVPQILAACAADFPGETYTDHFVFNCGQSESTNGSETFALDHGNQIVLVRAGVEALLGKSADSTHIEIARLDIPGQLWVNTVRTAQLAVPGATFTFYDDIVIPGGGLHPDAAGQNILGARRAVLIRQFLDPSYRKPMQTPKRLVGPLQLPNAAATQYTVPTATIAVIKRIRISNPTGGAVTFNLSIGADAAGTRLYSGVSVAAGSSLDIYGPFTLAAAEVIQAFASAASSLAIVIDGSEQPA